MVETETFLRDDQWGGGSLSRPRLSVTSGDQEVQNHRQLLQLLMVDEPCDPHRPPLSGGDGSFQPSS